MMREFINENDPNNPSWEPLEEHERAWTSCTAPYVCMCCGRGVHKTTTMIELLYYWMINKMFIPGDPGLLIFVPNKAQKDAIFPKIRAACEKHWLISALVDHNKINVQEGRIEFLNGFTLIMRIAGSEGKESNVISIHTSRIWVDEAQDFPWRAWMSLSNVLKREIPGHMLWVSGVPNGERRENVLYECDQEDPYYISFNISQPMMSNWTLEMELQAKRKYHSMQELSEDYKHYILGEHGVPVLSIFDRVRFAKADYTSEIRVYTQEMFEKAKIIKDGQVEYEVHKVLSDIPLMPNDYGQKPQMGLGYDVGFRPDPAVFFVMYKDINTGKWRNLVRLILKGVEYSLQREVLLFLDQTYGWFEFIGMDMGGPGKVQYQDLTGELSKSEYKERKFYDRIYPVEFGGMMVVSKNINDLGEEVEMKNQTKRVAVDTLSRWVHEHQYNFAIEDDDLMAELERTKVTRSSTGEPVYKTDDDHQMAAMMCAIMAYENKFGTPLLGPKVNLKPELTIGSLGWLDSKTGSFYARN